MTPTVTSSVTQTNQNPNYNQELQSLIREAKGGRIFSAVFIKKDGTERKMVCRCGVKKYLTGEGMKYNPADYGLLTVFDMQKREYRMINLKTLIRLKVNGAVYEPNRIHEAVEA